MKTYIEIRDAKGGRDAKILVDEMADIFQRSAKLNGFSCGIDHWREGFVVLWLTGNKVLKFYQKESGIHKWIRIPPTEKRGRVHTSTVSVAVMHEKPKGDVSISPNEIRRYYSKASSKGGQNANKNENCVSIHHLPTGIQVVCKDTKSKTKNEELAMLELKKRVNEQYQQKANKKHVDHRNEQIDEFNIKRTYQLNESYALDHQTGVRVKMKEVLKGKIEKFYA